MKALLGLVLLVAATIVGSSDAHAWGESFRQTCHVRAESYNRIQADCLDTSGYYRYNDFNKTGCVGDIANNNGYLQCSRQGGYNPPGGGGYNPPGGYNPGLPGGSYQQTCTSCSSSGGSLTCQCLDTQGYYHYTSLYNFYSCRGDIANMYGSLTCTR